MSISRYDPGSWFERYPRPEATLRLLCFPYAGAGASVFQHWPNQLPASVEVWAAQPPGREHRIGESPLRTVDALAEQAVAAGGPAFDEPYVLFGHSLGACVVYEIARRLRATSRPDPLHLIASGRRAPHLESVLDRPPMHTLSDEEFIERLRELDGTPAQVLADEQMMELLLPVLRADTEAAETYDVDEASLPEISCPVTALGGTDDTYIPREHVAGWAQTTSGSFDLEMLSGGHFFIDDRSEAVTDLVADVVATCAGSSPVSR
jgi:medium-chain acyl-[acyl-carrier-protein] hydrolase